MQVLWSQDIFSKGELSPLMYSRVTVAAYYNGLKTARNAITYPQGGIGKRFGTLFQAEIPYISNYLEAYFESFQYLNECTYVLILVPDKILVYLEGTLVATVTGTGYVASEIQILDTTTLDSRFRVTSGVFRPKDLVRTPSAANVILSATASEFTLTTPITAGLILPVQFTTAGTLPVTTPQVRTNRTYFSFATSTLTMEIYSTATDAKARAGKFVITNAGIGVNNIVPQNTWTFADVNIKDYPWYDFVGGYDAINFTPAATSGYNIQITANAPIFTPAHVDGAFFGNGGITRIVTVDSTTVIHVDIVTNFDSTVAIPGRQVLLAEPAWSDTRGWPEKCSSFQNRSVFSTTGLLPNGLWLSVINDYDSFNDLEADDDNAISWFPSSDNVNYIRFIVPYRSLTIHTNTGIFSTPLSFEQAVTPTNFSMTLQDSTPATSIQPRGIDNQIVILSGNDVHSMLWDGFNNSYTSTIASIANEHLIRNPHDEAAYVDLRKAGSRYMFIINDDGTMVVFQTLISENVQGFTPAHLDQTYGEAYFRWATASTDGRAWFMTERQIGVIGSPVAISSYSANNLTAVGSNFSTTIPTAATFTFTSPLGSMPASDPALELATTYWIIGESADVFAVYATQIDALAALNPFSFTSDGNLAFVIPVPLETKFYLEQLSFDVFVDCATVYDGAATSTITGQDRFNGQNIKIQGDGFGFDDMVADSTVEITAHGSEVEVSVAQLGFPINFEVQPLQVAPPGQLGPKGSALVYPQHIRTAIFMFNDTVGGYIEDTPIQLQTLSEIIPGLPPEPLSGTMEMSFMKGWNEVNKNPITITHSDPFDIKLIGIFYTVET